MQLFLIFSEQHFQRKGQGSDEPPRPAVSLVRLRCAAAINYVVVSDFLLKQLCVVISD